MLFITLYIVIDDFRYKNDEISLARAAKIAGISFESMKRILIKNGYKNMK
jgi:predicted HTH domain antitoxin